jgi:hypothetical protein
VRVCVGHRSVSHAVAAGATWTNRTLAAPWAARRGHTSVIDAAGTIYVIGGIASTVPYWYPDVWASTDGGAHRTRAGGGRGVLGGYSGVLQGVLQGYYEGTSGVLKSTIGHPTVLDVYYRSIQRYCQGTMGYYGLLGYYRSTQGTRGMPRRYLGVMGYSGGTPRAFPWPGGDLRYL